MTLLVGIGGTLTIKRRVWLGTWWKPWSKFRWDGWRIERNLVWVVETFAINELSFATTSYQPIEEYHPELVVEIHH